MEMDAITSSDVPLTDEDQVVLNEVLETLGQACDRAYRNGVDSAEIYKTLDFHLKKYQLECSSRRPSYKVLLEQLVTLSLFIRKVFWMLIIFTFTSVGIYLSVCDFLHLNPLYQLPSAFLLHEKRCLLPSNPFIMEITRPIVNCSICTPHPKTGSQLIEFKTRPSKEEFLKVGYTSKPIIIRGTNQHSKSRPAFTFETLKNIFESEPGGVESVSDECQFLPFRSSFKNLQEVFKVISVDSRDWGEPWYIGWSNCHPGVVSKLRKLFPRPEFLPTDSETSAIDWIFIGSPGHGAAMHLDYVRRPSWQAQLSGKKKWTLKPPPECEAGCTDSISFTISAGDMIFLDTNSWYHETFIEGEELSISIGSEYD